VLENTQNLIQKLHKPVVHKEDLLRLEAVEQAEAERLLLEEFKYGTNEEMLVAMGMTAGQRLRP
jgi:hypothetical protein